MKILIGCLVCMLAITGMAPAQPPKKATRPFLPPVIFPLTNPIIAKDEPCIRDLTKALALEGLAERKFLADLFKYGCLNRVEGIFNVSITAVHLYRVGPRQVPLHEVHLINKLGGDPIDGWVLGSQLISLDELEIAFKIWQSDQKKQ